jgi:hypothetical protein
MRERAGERLLDLGRDRGPGVVRQAVILALPEGELGLQEQVGAGHQPLAIAAATACPTAASS